MGLLTIHLLAVIILVQVTAFVSVPLQKVPYYPIEFSRTAASSVHTNQIFTFGALSLVLSILIEERFTLLLPWFGLFILAAFDDVYHWDVHMCGIFMMMIGVVLHLLFMPKLNDRFTLFLCANIIYVIRVVLKFFVVASAELSLLPWQWHERIPLIFDTCLHIMYHGSSNEVVLLIFKTTAVLQWLTFYLLYMSL